MLSAPFDQPPVIKVGNRLPGSHVTVEPHEFCYKHRWRPIDLVLWNNRVLMHRAKGYDMARYPRVFRRTTVAGLRADPRPLLPGRPGQGPPTRRRLIPGPHTRPPFPGRLCDQHVTTCGNCRKWRSDVQRTRSCWTAREAIQRSFVGMGVPLSRSWRNSCA